MTLALRGITPDPMGWALGRALYDQTPKDGGPWPWHEMQDSDQLWHARRAQWYLDHTDRGPGQWPVPSDLVAAQVLWDQTEYPHVLPKWEDYTPTEQDILVEQAAAALDAARDHLEDTP